MEYSEIYSNPIGSFVAGFPKGQATASVCIWETEQWNPVSSFECIWDFGGRRCAFADSLIVTASYKRGVAAYRVHSGELVWSRRDLRKTQQLTFYKALNLVFCMRSHNIVDCIDAATGTTVKSVKGYDSIYAHPIHPIFAACSDTEIALKTDLFRDWKDHPVRSFGTLSAALSGEHLIVSEVNSGIRGFGLATGDELPIQKGEGHYLALASTPSPGHFVGVDTESSFRLCWIDAVRGLVLREVCSPGLVGGSFVAQGSRFLRLSGELIDTTDGTVVRECVYQQ